MHASISGGLTITIWSICVGQLLAMGLTSRAIDLRSDTVTRPTPAMRTAMFEAEVGDDVFGDDPTIIKLEEKMCQLFQKESALFFPSGTMSNLAATMSWCSRRGSEMILGDSSHMFLYEQGGVSQLAGVLPRCLENQKDGTIDVGCIEKAIRQSNIHFPVTELIALEDTHNFCGGRILPRGYLKSVGDFAHSRGIAVHLDGARIWNAAAASQIPLHEIVKHADSVSICLSKGLGAPSGSILVGPRDFVERARRSRKALGGGMRQVGILAAAGLQGIADYETGILLPDHIKARMLADSISSIPGFSVAPNSVETNIVLVKVDTDGPEPAVIAGMLKEMGVLVLPFGDGSLRLVTHRDIIDQDVPIIISAFRNVALNAWPQSAVTIPIPTVQITFEDLNDGSNTNLLVDGDSEPLIEENSIARVSVEKTESTRHLIKKTLLNENIFRPNLTRREIDMIVDAAEGLQVSPGDTVIRQGDSAEFFYIIESGRVDRVSSDGLNSPVWESLTDSDFFGAIALIYDVSRSATVVATENTTLWRIHKKYFFFVCRSLITKVADQTTRQDESENGFISPDIRSQSMNSLQSEATGTVLESVEVAIVEKLDLDDHDRVIVDTNIDLIIKHTPMTMGEYTTTSSAVEDETDEDKDVEIDIAALRAWESLEAERSERRHLDFPVKDVPLIEEEEDVQYYEETTIHGMSLSDDGFCVLLKGVVCERVLRVLVTPSDPMADGLDRDQVDTTEAVTLLQLLQGIDVESFLSRDMLATKFAESGPGRQQYSLQRVMIDNVDSSKKFNGRLYGCGVHSGMHQSSAGADIALPISVLPQHSFDHPLYESLAQGPHLVVTHSLGEASDEVDKTTSLERIAVNLLSQDQQQGSGRVHKEVDLDSAFVAIALALRHSAAVEVRSSLLQDELLSYSLEELPTFFPKLVKSDIALEDRGRFGADYDARSEMERLQRRLYEAIRQGNAEKIDPIKRQLEFHSQIDGRSVLVLPPPNISLAPIIDVSSTTQQGIPNRISLTE